MRTLRLFIALMLFLGIITIGGGWYLSELFEDAALLPDHVDEDYQLKVVNITDNLVTLRVKPGAEDNQNWERDGVLGLVWQGGYGQVKGIINIADQEVTREFKVIEGNLELGDLVRVDSFVFQGDPEKAFSVPFEEVLVKTPLGHFPAWYIDGHRDIWVILVHGKGASQREALRMLPTIAELGFPTLIITYRNDEGVPPSSDGYFGYGQSEWKDLEGAVNYALKFGSEGNVLVGFSMGGAIVTSFLYKSPIAETVLAVIMDSPMLDFDASVDLGGSNRGYPQLITSFGKMSASLRFGINWEDLDYLSRIDELNTPVLLLHGDADDTTPVESSDIFAQKRPDLVKYVRFDDAWHVGSWNMYPEAYEKSVSDFLKSIIPAE